MYINEMAMKKPGLAPPPNRCFECPFPSRRFFTPQPPTLALSEIELVKLRFAFKDYDAKDLPRWDKSPESNLLPVF
jgi:hypothetical protein